MNNITHWNQQYSAMDNFGQNRPEHMRSHMRSKFGLQEEKTLTVQVSPEDAGVVRVHSLTPTELPWTGSYFPLIPLDVEAIAAAGYTFSHWDNFPSSDAELILNLASNLELTAVFVENPGDEVGIVINEINYNSNSDNDTKDWVELHNAGSVDVNLNGWYISDSNDDNQFPLVDVNILAGEYLVVSSDTAAFNLVHNSSEMNLIGDFDFNFSNGGELIRLFDPLGSVVDSLSYDDEGLWPTEADGDGPTLELIHPTLDNAMSTSWAVSDALGTPGMINSRFSIPSSIAEGQVPTEFGIGLAFPNPFNAQVSLPLEIPETGAFQVDIFDIRGRLIRSELIEQFGSHAFTFRWDGKTADGVECSSGMYVLRLSQNSLSSSVKVALLR